MTKTMTCSYCGASDTILCKQPHGYASITLADKKISFNGQTLYHEICKSCGTVVRSYINEPEKLQKRQESLEQQFWGFLTYHLILLRPMGLQSLRILRNVVLTYVRTASMPLSSAAPDGLAITKNYKERSSHLRSNCINAPKFCCARWACNH